MAQQHTHLQQNRQPESVLKAASSIVTAPLTPQLQQYQNSVLAMRQTVYMDYPAHVHLETLSLCPAACNFCPYPTLERKGNRMSDELLHKIIMDLKDIPQNIPFQLSPFKVNEPFLDTRLIDLLKTINKELPNASITLTSNTTPITEDKLAELATIKNLGYLWISLNDHRPEEYAKTMQLSWDRTYGKLQMIHAAKQNGTFPFRVVLSRVGDGSPADVQFCQWVQQTFPLFEFSVFQRGTWIGQVDTTVNVPVPNVGCVRWFDVSITSTGQVAHCCMDGQAKWPVGDVSKEHVLYVYNQPEYRKLREKTLTRLDVEPCNTCTFL